MLKLLTAFRWTHALLALVFAAVFAGCATLETQQRKWIFQASTTPKIEHERSDGIKDVWIDHHSRESDKVVTLHSPKRFVLVEGGTHYSTNGRGQSQYREALRELFGAKL